MPKNYNIDDKRDESSDDSDSTQLDDSDSSYSDSPSKNDININLNINVDNENRKRKLDDFLCYDENGYFTDRFKDDLYYIVDELWEEKQKSFTKNNAKRQKNNDKVIVENLIPKNNNNKEFECKNPLCNHKNYDDDPTPFNINIKSINSIDDLIILGKTFHCKKNNVLNGVNLRILYDLIEPLTELKNLIGMKQLKEQICNQIVFFVQDLNHKDKCGECIDCIHQLPCNKKSNLCLHTAIYGAPGVGKTSVAKVLAKVYKAMGILKKGHMIYANRESLVGKYVGHTSPKVRKLLEEAEEGVLVLDEIYSLGGIDKPDTFAKEAIDALVFGLLEKRFICIILGYKEPIEKYFFAYNEGLARRFPFRYTISNYSPDELLEIFNLRLNQAEWRCSCDKKDLLKLFIENKDKFENQAGDIINLISCCQIEHARRSLFLSKENKKILNLEDIKQGIKNFLDNKQSKTIDAPPPFMYL